jgi:hypothetical protein
MILTLVVDGMRLATIPGEDIGPCVNEDSFVKKDMMYLLL